MFPKSHIRWPPVSKPPVYEAPSTLNPETSSTPIPSQSLYNQYYVHPRPSGISLAPTCLHAPYTVRALLCTQLPFDSAIDLPFTFQMFEVLVWMDEILHHLGALNYCNSWDFGDLRWCKISSINSITAPEPEARNSKLYVGIGLNFL